MKQPNQPRLQPIEWCVSTRLDDGTFYRSPERYTLIDAAQEAERRNGLGEVWWVTLMGGEQEPEKAELPY